MDQMIVSLEQDGPEHLMGENETTLCGLPVRMGGPSRFVDHSLPNEGTTKPCPECFPDTAKPKKAKKDADAA